LGYRESDDDDDDDDDFGREAWSIGVVIEGRETQEVGW